MKRKKPSWRHFMLAAGFFWWGSLLPAEAPPSGGIPSALWDGSASSPLPTWFGPVQSFATSQSTVWRASLRPPPGPSRLAATFVFEETAHGVARLIWQGSGRAVVLSPNLFEGAAPLHQRTLLLDRQTLGGAGELLLESSGSKPVLVRAEFSWVEPLVLAATSWTPPGLFLAPSGKIYPAEELEGQAVVPSADWSRDRLVDAVLDPGPVSCLPNTPVRFLSSMPVAPSHGRLQAQVAGLSPGEEPEIWVNGWRLPAVALEVPGLEDPGYRATTTPQGTSLVYGGWRMAVASVPPGWLRRGENEIEWISPGGAAGMTLRRIRLQVSYGSATLTAPRVMSPTPAFSPAVASPKLRLGLSSPRGALTLRSE